MIVVEKKHFRDWRLHVTFKNNKNLLMKNSFLLLLISTLFLTSCYVYKPVEAKKGEKLPSVKEQLQPEKIYKIDVDQKTYVVKIISWEKDSLVAQTNLRKDVKKNFAENQIKNVRTREFSDARSNVFTVLTYAAIAAGVIFLVK